MDTNDWKPGDPCAACGSTKTGWDPALGGFCNGCDRTDADE